MDILPYSAVRPRLKTLDIALFAGRGLASWVIRRATRSHWTHVGLLIRDTSWDQILLWESTTLSKSRDVRTGKHTCGVQATLFSDRLREYGEAGIRMIRNPITTGERGQLARFRHEMTGRPYELRPSQLIRSAWDGFLGKNTEDLRYVFCSELVAAALKRLGRMITPQPASEYTPGDFGGPHFDDLYFPTVITKP